MKPRLHNLTNKPERLFLLIGSVFGLLTVFMMPALTTPDEGAHFWISYGMFSKNEQIPKDLLVSAEDSVKLANDGTYIDEIIEDKADLNGDGIQLNHNKTIYIRTEVADKNPEVSSFDIAHLPQALGVLVGRLTHPSIGVMTTLGRLANLVFFLAAMYFILKSVNHGKLALTFIALFPMIIYQAASLSYDVANIVAIFAWLALMINLFTQKTSLTRKQLLLLVVLVVALIATKRSNVLLLAFIPFLPPSLYKNTKPFTMLSRLWSFKIDKKILKMIFAAVAVVISLLGLALVYKYMQSHGINGSRLFEVLFNTFFRPEVNAQLDPILTTGLVGHFGWLWYRLPEWLVIIHLIVFALILLGDKIPRVSKTFAITSVMLLLLSILGITLGMYFEWTLRPNVGGIDAKFAQGMQGRYFTPLLVLLVPFFAYLQRYISVTVDRKMLTTLAATMAVFSLTTYMVLTYVFFYTPATGVKDILL